MEKLTFIALYVTRLAIDNILGLIKSTIKLALAVKDDLGDIPLATLNQLIANNELFEPTVNNPRKSEFTDLVNLANNDRKERFGEIKRNVKLHLKGRDAGKKAAAKKLDFFLSSYWDLLNEPMNTFTGLIKSMFEKYKDNIEIQAAAKLIGIDAFLDGFETSNNDFDVIYNQRLANDAAHELSASGQKRDVCNSYTEFCNAIEQAVNFTPNESIHTLFNKMNELRKTYHALEPVEKEKTDKKELKEA
jgi:hypothetical protein